MIEFNKKELRRLAKEARVLAMEVAGGLHPARFKNDSYATCAIGEAATRAGLMKSPDLARREEIGANIETAAFGVFMSCNPDALVSEGLRFSNPDGAVFPLLALADALEDAAEPQS